MTYESALAALADPTRRAIFERLRLRDHSVGELARIVRVSQPAVSQHLRALRRARLAVHRREGARRFYRADPRGLAELRAYLDAIWGDVLNAFAEPAPRASSTDDTRERAGKSPALRRRR